MKSTEWLNAVRQEKTRSPSPDTKAVLGLCRERLVPALVIAWTSETAKVLCPFTSCRKVHTHCYRKPKSWHPNARLSHCRSSRQEYRLLFPFEDDPVVGGFGVELDRERCLWKTVGADTEDLKAVEEDISVLSTQLAGIKITTLQVDYQLGIEETDREGLGFISECVCGSWSSCEQMLHASPDCERLVKGKNAHGNSALALVCMDGHLQVMQLLCKHGAALDSTNGEGKTPLLEALYYGHGAIAAHLVGLGASVHARDNEGTLILDMAKATLEKLEDREWLYSRMESETEARYLDRKMNREHFTRIIDLCTARISNLKMIQKSSVAATSGKQSIAFVQTGTGRATKISVFFNKFTAPLVSDYRTFAYLNCGSPFKDVFAASGYSQGDFGGLDGCLDREEWTAKVFMFSRAIGHKLKICPKKDGEIPGSFYACHAEKQVMAYFLWKHTALHEETTGEEDEKTEERNLKLDALQESKPAMLRIMTDIYVSREVCLDCDGFQKHVLKVTGIDFNTIFLPVTRPG